MNSRILHFTFSLLTLLLLLLQPLSHDHLEAVVMSILGQQSIHNGQGLLLVDRLVVAAIILPAGQGQGSRGRLLEMVADNSHTFIPVFLNTCMSFRNPCAAIPLWENSFRDSSKSQSNRSSASCLFRTYPFKICIQQCQGLHILGRLLVQFVDLVICFFISVYDTQKNLLRPTRALSRVPPGWVGVGWRVVWWWSGWWRSERVVRVGAVQVGAVQEKVERRSNCRSWWERSKWCPKCRVFSSPDPLCVLIFQFPRSFVELRSLRVFIIVNVFTTHTLGSLDTLWNPSRLKLFLIIRTYFV